MSNSEEPIAPGGRRVVIDFVKRDGKNFVDVSWSPMSAATGDQLLMSEAFKPVLHLAISAIMPKSFGFSEAGTKDDATMGAVIDRDIQTAGRKEAP